MSRVAPALRAALLSCSDQVGRHLGGDGASGGGHDKGGLVLPAARYGPAPPDLPTLLQRVRALEGRSGVVPGLAPLPGLGTQPSSAVVADTPAGWAGRAAWPGFVGAAVAVFLIALTLLPSPGGAPRRVPTAPAAGCIAVSTSGVPGEGCTPAVTPAQISRPAILAVAVPTATLTEGDIRFWDENDGPWLLPERYVPTIWDFREDHRVPIYALILVLVSVVAIVIWDFREDHRVPMATAGEDT